VAYLPYWALVVHQRLEALPKVAELLKHQAAAVHPTSNPKTGETKAKVVVTIQMELALAALHLAA